jgi:hypothetical protein
MILVRGEQTSYLLVPECPSETEIDKTKLCGHVPQSWSFLFAGRPELGELLIPLFS